MILHIDIVRFHIEHRSFSVELFIQLNDTLNIFIWKWTYTPSDRGHNEMWEWFVFAN